MRHIHPIRDTPIFIFGALAGPALLYAQTSLGTAFTHQEQLKRSWAISKFPSPDRSLREAQLGRRPELCYKLPGPATREPEKT